VSIKRTGNFRITTAPNEAHKLIMLTEVMPDQMEGLWNAVMVILGVVAFTIIYLALVHFVCIQ